MLIEFQKLKENDDHIHEYVVVGYDKGDGGGVNTHDHVETLCEDMISEDESLHVVCAIYRKVYELFTNGRQPIDDMTPDKDEVFDLSRLVMEKVITVFPRNTLLPAKEDMSVCDAGTFGTIRLRPRLPYIMKPKPIQMDEQSTFINRNLNV